MLTWLKISFRNLLQNKRRSLATIGAIAFGFAAINLLGGFTDYIFKGLEDSYIYTQSNGHLSVFKKDFLVKGSLDPGRFLLSEQELKTIITLCQREPEVVLSTPQLNISGLLSNGSISTIMMAVGKDPAACNRIRNRGRGFTSQLKLYKGTHFSDDAFAEAGISNGLARKLGLSLGSEIVIMTSTVDGFMNAMDANVIMTFNAAIEVLDNLCTSIPLSFAQSLYDTKGADRVNILLKNNRHTALTQKHLQTTFSANGLATEILTWEELQPSYLRIKNMFNVIFSFVFFIVMVIVVLSVINTISMAVVERTRETGTLRALGLKRSGVIKIFALESAMLAGIGSFVGLLLTILGWAMVVYFKPTWIPPTIPTKVPLEIHLVPGFLIFTTISMIVLATGAAIISARRASQMSIIDALGHI